MSFGDFSRVVSLARIPWRIVAVLFVQLLFAASMSMSWADQPRRSTSFTSPNGQFEARLVSGGTWNAEERTLAPETWGVFEVETNDLEYRIAARLSPKTVFVSSSGAHLIAVNDYMRWDSAPAVVELFHDGTPVGEYSLSDLLPDTLPVSRSASHTHWLIGKPAYDDLRGTIALTTIALDTYTFDVASGAVVSTEQDKRLTADTLFVYGQVRRAGSREYVMDVLCPLHGEVTCGATVRFRRTKKTPWASITHGDNLARKLKPQRYASVLVRNGLYVAHDDLLLVNDCACAGKVAN